MKYSISAMHAPLKKMIQSSSQEVTLKRQFLSMMKLDGRKIYQASRKEEKAMHVQALFLGGKRLQNSKTHDMLNLNFKLMMVSGGRGAASKFTDTSEIWTGFEWRFTLGKLPYTAGNVRMAFIDNRILYLGNV